MEVRLRMSQGSRGDNRTSRVCVVTPRSSFRASRKVRQPRSSTADRDVTERRPSELLMGEEMATSENQGRAGQSLRMPKSGNIRDALCTAKSSHKLGEHFTLEF